MTIAAAYLTSEGVVFGADSSTTVMVKTIEGGSGGVAQLLNHAQKVFEVGIDSRLGICTWGAGSIGEISHRTIIAQLAEKVDQSKTTVREAAELLGELVMQIFIQGSGQDFIGYYIGGWEPNSHIPACFRVEITGQGPKIEPLSLGACSFSGAPQFFTRVFRGFDLRLPKQLLEELLKRLPQGTDRASFEKIFKESFSQASAPLIAAGYQDLPIREAIDFVYSYLHITVKAMKFTFGAPIAGGPIEVGFISTDRAFRWVLHKGFSSAIIEEEAENGI